MVRFRNGKLAKPQVILRSCPNYDPQKIRRIIREGLDELGLQPYGRVLVKPNCVTSGRYFPHAFTRAEFLEGVLLALKDRKAADLEEIALGERCGITVPTRMAFREAGYYPMLKRVGGIKCYHFEETPQREIPLRHPGRLRDSIFVPEPVARADFFVNCPKFKAHPWTTVTFSMKNYIGIQDDRHRLIDHDHKLNQKVADLQYVLQPQFIAIDAIVAGEGRMLTPIPFDLGLIIMGNNQVAFDAVCCHIVGLDPMQVEHIKLAYQRGFGPVDLKSIKITGDVRLEQARRKARGFRVGLIRVEEYFKGTRIRAYAGSPPKENGSHETYCWGGCPGALEEAIEILRVYDQSTDQKMPPIHVVFGAYDGEIPAKRGEKVVFIGDCATYEGRIAATRVRVPFLYQDRSAKSPYHARHQDIYIKMLQTAKKLWQSKKQDFIRIRGCPVSVAEQVLLLVGLGGLKNPYFDRELMLPFNYCYLSWRTRSALNQLFGKPYQIPGPVKRGDTRPAQDRALH